MTAMTEKTKPMISERPWIVLIAGGAEKSVVMRAVLISTPPSFPWAQPSQAVSLPNLVHRDKQAARRAFAAPGVDQTRSHSGSTAKHGCTPQCSSDREGEFAKRNRAWRQIRWSSHRRSNPAAPYAGARCDTKVADEVRAVRSSRCRRPAVN